ncbi:MAG: hypothetical protein KDF65_01550 [Anaerolineae bacterium]|nr:hypothetical protein [Anaerolineae bacterium]
MKLKFYSQIVVEKLSVFLGQLVEEQRPAVPRSQPGDGLYTEIYRLEKRLSRTPTRPLPVGSYHEPITEQQKIMDMSG